MKIFVSLLILASLALTINGKEIPETVVLLSRGLHQECVKESKVSEELIAKANTGEFSESREFKCYLGCWLEKLTLISKSGEFNFDGMINIIPSQMKEIGTAVINICREKSIGGSDNCERSFNLNTCVYNANPEEYFLL